MSKGQVVFGSGALLIKDPTTKATMRVGTLQEVSFDFKASNKSLEGENLFAEAIGRGGMSISGKAKTGRFNGELLNRLFFAQPTANVTAEAKLLALDEPITVDADGTVSCANAANFLEDAGASLADGTSLTRVLTGTPTASQYRVDEVTGAYTFAASLTGQQVRVSYLYKTAAAGAGNLKLSNQLAGEAPTFRGIFVNKFQGKTMTLILNALVSESLGMAFKNGDFAMPDFSFAAQVDDLGELGEMSLTQFA